MPQQPRRSRRLAKLRTEEGLADAQSSISNSGSPTESDETDDTLPSNPFASQLGGRHSFPLPVHVPPHHSANRAGSGDRTEHYSEESYDSDADMEIVSNPNYRYTHLMFHKIDLRHAGSAVPEVIARHVQAIAQAGTEHMKLSPDHEADAIRILEKLGLGCTEMEVINCLSTYIFPSPDVVPSYGPATGLAASSGSFMGRHLMPPQPPGAPYPLPQPRPDALYGYPMTPKPFTDAQVQVLVNLHPEVLLYPSTGSLYFPFLAAEFKAAAGTGGNLWVASNQCAGVAAACLQAVDQLNTVLKQHGCAGCIANLCYSFAVDNNLAQLYVSWKEVDGTFCMQRVESFLLSQPEHLSAFRCRVLCILEWGRSGRLNELRSALDFIVHARQKQQGGY